MKLPLLVGFIGALIFITYNFENRNAPAAQGKVQGSLDDNQAVATQTPLAVSVKRVSPVRTVRALVCQSTARNALPIRVTNGSLREQSLPQNAVRGSQTSERAQRSMLAPQNLTRETMTEENVTPVTPLGVSKRSTYVSRPIVQAPLVYSAQLPIAISTQAISSVPDVAVAVSAAMSGAVAEIVSEVMVLCKDPRPQPVSTTWTMFDVSLKVGQADCHLLEFPGGKKVLIDAAEGYDAQGAALGFLQQAGVTHLDLVVISHMHWDHYGRLIDLVNSGITVDRVALSLPASREIADVEMPWGCNWDDVQSLLQFLRDHQIPYWMPQFGEKLVEVTQNGVSSVLEVVCLYDAINTPVGRTDVNDTSMLVRLRHGSIKALFTGDLNMNLGAWLATSNFDLKADLLKVPHHGTDGLAPNEFFDRVAPKVALVPSPRELWYSLRSKRAREYFASRSIPTYVNGVDGTVKVRIDEDSYEISTSGQP